MGVCKAFPNNCSSDETMVKSVIRFSTSLHRDLPYDVGAAHAFSFQPPLICKAAGQLQGSCLYLFSSLVIFSWHHPPLLARGTRDIND